MVTPLRFAAPQTGGHSSEREIQSILFAKDKYDSKTAKSWLKAHMYKPIKRVHVTKKFRRYRISEPVKGAKYRTEKLGDGIEATLRMGGGSRSKTVNAINQIADSSRFNAGPWNRESTYDYPMYSYDGQYASDINALDNIRYASRAPPTTTISISHEDKSMPIYHPEASAIQTAAVGTEPTVNAIEELRGMGGGSLAFHNPFRLPRPIIGPPPFISQQGYGSTILGPGGIYRGPPLMGGQIRHPPPEPRTTIPPGVRLSLSGLTELNRIREHQTGRGQVSLPYSQQRMGERPYAVFH